MNLSTSLMGFCSGLLLAGGLMGQAAAQGAGDLPRLPSGKPDLNGFWEFPYVADMAGQGQRP